MAIDPLYVFVFVGLFTPGPNVILMTASGARFGISASLPHLFGVVVGVGITSGLTGIGVGTALSSLPWVSFSLRCLSALWILYMASELWRARTGRNATAVRPMRFSEAVLFQWVNPKVWAIAFAAASGHPGGGNWWEEALRLASAFSGINLGVCLFWTSAGAVLTYLLTTPTAWTVFARTMAIGLALNAVLVFY